MTNPNKAHVTLVCDRTGSMSGLQAETEKGVNAFINDRKVDPVDVSLLLVQFDAQDPFEVLHDGPVASAPEYHLAPRGLTPLLDCVGRAIVRTGESLAALAEDERPDKVVFVIATDGLENASTEYTWASVQEMIKRQTDDYSWQFVYLGIAADAWGQEAQLGVTVHTNSSAHGGVEKPRLRQCQRGHGGVLRHQRRQRVRCRAQRRYRRRGQHRRTAKLTPGLVCHSYSAC